MKTMKRLIVDKKHNLSVEDYQNYIRELYSRTNENRDFANIYGYLHRNIGNLGKSLQKDDNDQSKFVSPISWMFSLANRLDFNLLEALIKKFPGFCPYCYEKTCICYKTEKQAPTSMSLEDMQEAMYYKWEEVKSSLGGFNLDKAVEFIANIYPNNEIIWIASGYQQHLLKIHQEMTEIHEAHSKYDRSRKKNHSPDTKNLLVPVMDEVADVFAWILSAWSIKFPEDSLDRAFKKYYIEGCDVCGDEPCTCERSDSPSEALFDFDKLTELEKDLKKLAFLFTDHENEYRDLLGAYGKVTNTQRESIAYAALNRTKAILEKTQATATIVDTEGASSKALLSAINIVNSLFKDAGIHHISAKTYDVFLSYSTANKDQSRILYNFLVEQNYKVFMDEKEISPSSIWEEIIKNSLKNSRLLCVLASPESLSSEWVTTEVDSAWFIDMKMLPILYHCAPKDLPDKLRKHHAIDFHEYEKIVDVLEALS